MTEALNGRERTPHMSRWREALAVAVLGLGMLSGCANPNEATATVAYSVPPAVVEVSPTVEPSSPIEVLTVGEGDSLYSLLEPYYGPNLNGGNASSRSIVVDTQAGGSYCLENVNAWSMVAGEVFPEINNLWPGDQIKIYEAGEQPQCDQSLQWLRSGFDSDGRYWFYYKQRIVDPDSKNETVTYLRFCPDDQLTETSGTDWQQ